MGESLLCSESRSLSPETGGWVGPSSRAAPGSDLLRACSSQTPSWGQQKSPRLWIRQHMLFPGFSQGSRTPQPTPERDPSAFGRRWRLTGPISISNTLSFLPNPRTPLPILLCSQARSCARVLARGVEAELCWGCVSPFYPVPAWTMA